MPIVDSKDILQHAHDHAYVVAGFIIDNLSILSGVIRAAEESSSPVILAVNNPQSEVLLPAIESAARLTDVPIAIQLCQVTSIEDARRGINSGANLISLDTDCSDNKTVRDIVSMCHACGVPVEAGLNSDIQEVQQFIQRTDIDVFNIDPAFSKLEGTHSIPLAAQAGLGINVAQCNKLIAHGVAHISFDSILIAAIDARIRLNTQISKSGYAELLQGVEAVIRSEAEACIELSQSAGQAESSLEYCAPWSPVEHVIIFNVKGIDDQQADAMMAEGRQSLVTIPGVRHVVTGRAIKEDAQYRFSWLIQFCHPAVIDSYRNHPTHIDFADRLFRPVAGDRISIDYQWNNQPVEQPVFAD